MEKPLGVAGKAIISKNGKILLVKRSLNNEFDPGLWEFPGGKIMFGENLTEGLKREVMEEVGLIVSVMTPFNTWNFQKEPFWVTGVSFHCDYLGGDVSLSPEHDAFEWIDPQEYINYPLSITVEEQIKAFIELKNQ